MKIERLYAITVYLLNHGRTSANELAKYFEVSVRTIRRWLLEAAPKLFLYTDNYDTLLSYMLCYVYNTIS